MLQKVPQPAHQFRRGRKNRPYGATGLTLFFLGCGVLGSGQAAHAATTATAPSVSANPPADGFNLAGSDPQAVALADATLAAMGGRAAWDHSRYLVWRFFGNRLHIWDRFTGRERLEFTDQKTGTKQLVLMNLQTKQGRVFRDDKEVTEAAPRAAALRHAEEAWINDSYWLLMPYKLKDSGVTLHYKGAGTLADGRPADILILTFAGVGVTPQNKYDVYIAKDSKLVEQWAYYEKFSSLTPEFSTPWQSWHRYGQVLLSGDRGKFGALTELAVPSEVPDSVFTQAAPVDLKQLTAGAAAAQPAR